MKGITATALYLDLCEDLLPWITREGAPEQSPTSVACCALRDSLFKKLASDVSQNADELALGKFLSVNERCGSWQLDIQTLEDELLVGELRACLHGFFKGNSMEPLLSDYHSFASYGSLGPGKSIGSHSDDFYTKLFDSELTCTSNGLYRMYRDYISSHPSWTEAEIFRLGRRGEAKVVRGNRLTFVPKTNDVSRTICVEPVLNMFFQQGIRHILEERLTAYFGIDLSTQQEKNRLLAQIGSERATCSALYGLDAEVQNLCTIDLSSASDSLSLGMLRAVMPSSTLDVLLTFRCPETQLPDGNWVKLNMISTMGNAFTFPLQTILFSSVVVAAARVSGLKCHCKEEGAHCAHLRDTFLVSPHGRRLGNFGVNGDDIICPRVISRKVLRLLQLLGFQVNSDKTFGTHNSSGLFRESCGADFYAGLNVRPVYCQSLDTPQDLYSLINRLNVWSFTQGIPLRKTLRRLLRAVPRYEVPPWEVDDCGIKVPLLRWCQNGTRKTKLGSIAYRRWVPARLAIRVDMETERILVPRGMKPISFNREGLYLAFLKGTIVNGQILLRPRRTVYTTKVGVAPNWESSPTMKNPFKGSFGGPALEKLACITLG